MVDYSRNAELTFIGRHDDRMISIKATHKNDRGEEEATADTKNEQEKCAKQNRKIEKRRGRHGSRVTLVYSLTLQRRMIDKNHVSNSTSATRRLSTTLIDPILTDNKACQ